MRKQSSDRLSNLPKITQPGNRSESSSELYPLPNLYSEALTPVLQIVTVFEVRAFKEGLSYNLFFFFLYSSSLYSCYLFLIPSASVRSIPFLSFIVPIFAWNVPLVALIFLKRSLVFPILLFSSISLHWSLRKAFYSLLAHLWNSTFRWIYLSFSPLPLASLLFTAFVRPPQTAILLFCISFSWGWSWSLPPVQCHKLPSIALQAHLILWIYLSLPLYNCKGFDLGHTWMV